MIHGMRLELVLLVLLLLLACLLLYGIVFGRRVE
jgi:hypothetical protein